MPHPTVQLVRANLAELPFDAVILPTKGTLGRGGVAHTVVSALCTRADAQRREALVEQVRRDFGSEIPVGSFRHVSVPDRRAKNGSVVRSAYGVRLPKAPSKAKEAARQRDLLRATIRPLIEHVGRSETGLVAVPSLGTGAGGWGHAEVAKALADALCALENGPSFVVVPYGPFAFRCYLEAFERAGLLDVDVAGRLAAPTHAGSIVDVCASAGTFLFVGSGLSLNAEPPKKKWSELFDSSWSAPPGGVLPAGWEKQSNLFPDLLQIVADKKTPAEVHRCFVGGVADERSLPGLVHYHLLNLPWSAIFTTNYDTLIEDTLRALNLDPLVVTHDEQLPELEGATGVPVIKLHGGVCRAGCRGRVHADWRDDRDGQARLAAPPVATRDDYDHFADDRPGLAAFAESKLLTARGLIVGYSLSDHHLRSLFARIGRITTGGDERAPRLFQLELWPSPLADYWGPRGLLSVAVAAPQQEAPQRLGELIAAVATAAQLQRARSLLPTPLPDRALEPLLKATEDLTEARLRLVTALVELGVPLDGTALAGSLAGPDAEQARRLARLHLSPERYAWLLRDAREPSGGDVATT